MRARQAGDMPARVHVDGIDVRIGDAHILEAVGLVAEPGTVVGLLGPNGSGKSTLLRTIFRSLPPTAGQVHLDRDDVWTHSVKWNAKQTAVVLQDAPTEFPLTCSEIVRMGRTAHKRLLEPDTAFDEDLCDAAMELMEITSLAHKVFSHVSGGERQRVLIARALVQQPRLLIMDEPTNHLDLHHQLSLLDLATKLGTTVVVALHDLNLAARYCDSVVLLDRGRVVAQGTPADVLTTERIAEVYRVDVQIIEHPTTGKPHIMLC
ncbi:iron complex transport system ATP-binding protein [Antricoccus suffuscus]|uniref:Iron complex transport system ATP-binding protein n=1 Tax=Antricoccus suffuscus TaxID=1629062 RepID=A0A2T1A743_9ACTN|nr:ABC transporter ATP-binding protein [Antricoccus suffuscus]PRZ44148.1 iron complex transport system ATP-binding protein [Antricoccus suffuscus]